jgi:hypothetical protein
VDSVFKTFLQIRTVPQVGITATILTSMKLNVPTDLEKLKLQLMNMK